MKLSHLSLAIFAAISLAACGGSNNNSQVTPEDSKPVQPKPEQTKPEVKEDKIVDPTQTGVVGDLDLSTEASVGTTQYIRGEKSKFDRNNNPLEETSATAILGVTLNKQNPDLTNIALAQLKGADGKAELVQFLGNEGTDSANLKNIQSLQTQNEKNVVLDDGLLTVLGAAAGNAVDETTIQGQIDAINNIIAGYQATASAGTLSSDQEETLAKLEALAAAFSDLKDQVADDEFGKGLIPLAVNDTTIKWGDNVANDLAHLNDGTKGTGPEAIGLVGVNYQDKAGKVVRVQGHEAKSESSTRIFGRNFNSDGGAVKYNSYLGATPILLVDNNTDYNQAAAAADATAADTAVGNATQKAAAYTLAAVPNKLTNIQYGRVTGNLNPAQLTKKQLKDGGRFYKQMNYLTKGNKSAVDTYFYRGTNATTLEQMAALPKGKELTYAGHALMYGLDNSFHGKAGDAVPNAFGQSNAHALGNFVIAKVDLDKESVKGSIYNEWQDKANAKSYADVLVSFDGNIFGNTVLGEAQRLYDTSDKADFRASFFGSTGEELGGSINSTTWQERYGADGDKWGGVFGAKRVEEVNQLTNQWLGDIPALTPSK